MRQIAGRKVRTCFSAMPIYYMSSYAQVGCLLRASVALHVKKIDPLVGRPVWFFFFLSSSCRPRNQGKLLAVTFISVFSNMLGQWTIQRPRSCPTMERSGGSQIWKKKKKITNHPSYTLMEHAWKCIPSELAIQKSVWETKDGPMTKRKYINTTLGRSRRKYGSIETITHHARDDHKIVEKRIDKNKACWLW